MIIAAQNERCGNWAKTYIPHVQQWADGYQTIGLEIDGCLVAATIYEHFTGYDIDMSLTVAKRATPAFVRACFEYPFNQLGCLRVSCEVASKNKASKELARRLGFKLEGFKREAIPDDTLLLYGMTKSECRWLR